MSNKAFIFDLDGVIVDTAKYHYLAWRNLANSLGFDFTEEQNEHLKGVSRVKSLEILLEIGNINLSEEKKKTLLDEKNNEYLEYVNKMTPDEILPGVIRVLDFLDKKGVKFALGSASKNASLILEKVDLLDRFTALIDGNDVSKAKPDPEVFLIAASKLKKDPENCIVVEDAIAGIQAANKATMLSVGIGSREVLNEANYVFKDMNEIKSEFLIKILNE
jgi:beta-phosphoglucomutase